MNELAPEVIIAIALNFKLPQILDFCQSNKRNNEIICLNERFWRLKTERDYRITDKKVYGNITWKNLYKKAALVWSKIWSKTKADLYAKKHRYIIIKKNGSEIDIGGRRLSLLFLADLAIGTGLLSGSKGRWRHFKTSENVFVPSLRVVGNPDVIRKTFIDLGYSADWIDSHLSDVYTKSNYNTTMKEKYDKEIEDYKLYRKEGGK